MPATCFGHTCGHPQGSPLQRIYCRTFLKEGTIVRYCFKICGLKCILQYQIQIKFCDKGKCVTNVLCGYCVLVTAIKLRDFCKRLTDLTLKELGNDVRRRSQLYITYLLTHSMEHIPSWEANQFSASQEIPTFCGTLRFITAFTSARHLSLSTAGSIQSMPPPTTSWRSILILSSHLHLGLSSGLFPSGFPTKTLYTPLFSPYMLHAAPISFFSTLSPEQYWVRCTVY